MTEALAIEEFSKIIAKLVKTRPLVHCLTNEVVQEITADVLLAAGASPAMCVAEEEAGYFAGISSAVLVNIGTPYEQRVRSMKLAVQAARAKSIPWVLDPVAAGVIPWRDSLISQFVDMNPTVVRGNASEILALAGMGSGGRGVDSLDSSSSAVSAASKLAEKTGGVVVVTGETDYITDSRRIIEVPGGNILATLVVGTGCSLSALTAAFCAVEEDRLKAAAAACMLAKRAQERAARAAKGPGSFRLEYLDALYGLAFGR